MKIVVKEQGEWQDTYHVWLEPGEERLGKADLAHACHNGKLPRAVEFSVTTVDPTFHVVRIYKDLPNANC